MKFTVVWQRRAEGELAAIWTNAEDRNAVSSAADMIDTALRSDPQLQGESRCDTIRIMFVTPLGVYFEVFEDDRLVRVLGVWRIRH